MAKEKKIKASDIFAPGTIAEIKRVKALAEQATSSIEKLEKAITKLTRKGKI